LLSLDKVLGGLLGWSIPLVPIGAVTGAYLSSPKNVAQCPYCKGTFRGRPAQCPECDAKLRYPGQADVDQPPSLKEVKEGKEVRETVREIVKVRCRYCGTLHDEVKDKCPSCGGR